MSRWFPQVALGLIATLCLVELFVILPHPKVLILLAIPVWFGAPGVLLARWSLADEAGSRVAAFLFGPAIGIGLSVFGLLLAWSTPLQGWPALLIAPFFTLAIAFLARRFAGVTLRLPASSRADIAGVSTALLVVPLITFAPYDHVREPVGDGEAYRAYFTADFVWAMTATAEIAKGDVPPANPFHRGEPMRYYWMSHLLSGAAYHNLRGWGIRTEHVVLVDGLCFGAAFVAFLYGLARSVGASPLWASIAVIVGFTANSYEGTDMIRAIVARGDSWGTLRDTNIDAVTRWFYRGMAVDGLQRLLLYQPHHLTGYMFALSSLWLTALAKRVDDISIALWAGIFLGLAFLFSTFSAIILGPAVALAYGVRLVQQRVITSAVQCALLGAAPLAVGISLSQTLGYTDARDGLLLEVGLNPVALRNWRMVLFLSFGPLLLIGIVGLLRPGWIKDRGSAPAILVLVALAFYFLTDVPDMGGVWVGWRSGHMLLIAFTTIGAAAMTALWQYRRIAWIVTAVALVAVLPAIPTVAIDVFNAQDITNRGQGATFPWTLVITPQERAALDWVRDNTPTTAIVQTEPYVRDSGTWSYVPGFAERRMAAGLPISMIPLRGYQEASEVVRTGIFASSSADEAHATALSLGVDYLLIGREERAAYAPQIARLAERRDLFEPVMRNDAITVLKVTAARAVGDDRSIRSGRPLSNAPALLR